MFRYVSEPAVSTAPAPSPHTITSMTGFARAEGVCRSTAWVWEIRSVNAKALDVRPRLGPFDRLDPAIRGAVGQRIKRGSLSVSLSVSRTETAPAVRVNQAIALQLVDQANALRERLAPAVPPLSLDGLLAVRGVVEAVDPETEDPEAGAAIEQALLAGFAQALSALVQARAEEGARLGTVLAGSLGRIEDLVGAAADTAATQPAAIRERLHRQIADLLAGSTPMPEDRLAQEAALLASRADVREELDRLRAHIAQARDLLGTAEPIGRRLDFLCQEFNREANTLCAKSSDVALTRIGLDLKATIEQFREQVQNVE